MARVYSPSTARPSGVSLRAVWLSMAIHAAVLLAAASFLLASDTRPQSIDTVVQWGQDEAPLAVLPELASADATIDDSGAPAAGPTTTAPLAMASDTMAEVAFASTLLTDASPGSEASAPSTTASQTPSGAEGTSADVGHGELLRTFLGDNTEGGRVVYIVDASRSMLRKYAEGDDSRFQLVIKELRRSVQSLDGDQEFFIIFFNENAHPMPSRRMVKVSDAAHRDAILDWAAKTIPGGKTNPEAALQMAVRLKPDVVFFLTDGSFPWVIAERLRIVNDTPIPIHAIGVANEEAEKVLVKLAGDSGGQYLFVADPVPSQRR